MWRRGMDRHKQHPVVPSEHWVPAFAGMTAGGYWNIEFWAPPTPAF